MLIDIGKGWVAAALLPSVQHSFRWHRSRHRSRLARGRVRRRRRRRPCLSGVVRISRRQRCRHARRRAARPQADRLASGARRLAGDGDDDGLRRARHHARSGFIPAVSRHRRQRALARAAELRLRDAAVRLLHASREHRANAQPAPRTARSVCGCCARAESHDRRSYRCHRPQVPERRRAASGCWPCWPTARSIPASIWRSACASRAAASGS